MKKGKYLITGCAGFIGSYLVDRLLLNNYRVISIIDNLVKGAAGQAVQNMNIMFNFNETLGLNNMALYP